MCAYIYIYIYTHCYIFIYYIYTAIYSYIQIYVCAKFEMRGTRNELEMSSLLNVRAGTVSCAIPCVAGTMSCTRQCADAAVVFFLDWASEGQYFITYMDPITNITPSSGASTPQVHSICCVSRPPRIQYMFGLPS